MKTKSNKSKEKKESVIIIRCTKGEKNKIQKNAGYKGMSRYIVDTLLNHSLENSNSELVPLYVESRGRLNDIYHEIKKDQELMRTIGPFIKRYMNQSEWYEKGDENNGNA